VNRQIKKLGVILTLLFLALFAQLNYIQVFHAQALRDNPANAYRQLVEQYGIDRGKILARDGKTVLATSVPTQGNLTYLRRYPRGSTFATATGFYSLLYGTSQLENTYNEWLSASAPAMSQQNLAAQLANKPVQGADIVTTIDAQLQQVATRALGNKPGAVIAMNPRTGEVYALVTYPTYNPNQLSSHNPKTMQQAWNSLVHDPANPMLSKAQSQLYPPGSTFKLVTASAALQNGFGPDSLWPNPPVLSLPLTTHVLANFGGEHCLGGIPQLTLTQAFTVSCNVVFGEVGLKLGAQALYDQAKAYGFDQQVPFDIPFTEGYFPTPSYFNQRTPALAFSAIGQDQVAANPMQMTLVASAIANGGVEMQPTLVSKIVAPNGQVLQSFAPKPWGTPISATTGSEMTQMMVDVVNQGTGTAAQIPGVQVAGKTGTAEHGTGQPPHAWFVSFAPANAPTIAVGVIVLDGGSMGSDATGGLVAAPIAKVVMEQALKEGL
jgi:peptidoglycan glycosyltransferase